MKKKWISLLLCLSFVASSLIACGSSSNKTNQNSIESADSGSRDEEEPGATTHDNDLKADGGLFLSKSKVSDALIVTLNEETYDLSKDFHDVIGDMVKNEIGVFDMQTGRNFSEAGYLETDKDKVIRISDKDATAKLKGSVFATNSSHQWPEGIYDQIDGFIYYNYYEFKSKLTLFQNDDGIAYSSAIEDLEKLSNYIPYHGAVNISCPGFAAVYFDDTTVDLSKYNQDIDDFKKELEENKSLELDDPNKQWYKYGINLFITAEDYNSLDRYDSELVASEIAITNALQDGVSKLKNGEIKNLYAVLYTFEGDFTDLDVFVYTDQYIYLNKDLEDKAKGN